MRLITAEEVDLYEVRLSVIVDGFLAELGRLEPLFEGLSALVESLRKEGLVALGCGEDAVHAGALRALRALPAEALSESERLHARHQWNERRRFLRLGQGGAARS